MKLGGGERPELTREVLSNADNKVNLSLSPFKKTKSPKQTTAEGRSVPPRALDFALGV